MCLTNERRVERAQAVVSTPEVKADDLMDAYHSVRSVYVETHPRSGLVEIDFSKQAAHFVAEACMACLAPIYPETQTQNLAVKVAMYCQMARTCAAIKHDEDYPKFEGTEAIVKKEVEAQYAILGEFHGSS